MHYIDSLAAWSRAHLSSSQEPHQGIVTVRKQGVALSAGPLGDLRRAEPLFSSGRGSPEAFRPNSHPSDARLVARGRGEGGGAARGLQTPCGSAPLLAPAPGWAARQWVWSPGVGGRKGLSGRAEKWEPSRPPVCRRPPGRSAERIPRARLGLGGAGSPSWAFAGPFPHKHTSKISFGRPRGTG